MSQGYSLIELLVVLAIISMIVLVAVPVASTTVERMTLSADARALTTELRALRTVALDRQTDIVLAASGSGNIADTSSGRPIELTSGTIIKIAGAGRDQRFVLRWDGTATGSIDLRRGESSLRVVADGLTGRFAVEISR